MSNWGIKKKSLTAVLIFWVPQCVSWCLSGSCHCNSYKKSDYWNRLRNCTLLGGLHSFNLTLSDMDAHLRHAGTAHRPLIHLNLKESCMLLNSSFLWHLSFFNIFSEKMLQGFKKDVFVEFSAFLKGKSPVAYGLNAPNQQQVIHEWGTGRFHSLQPWGGRCHFSSNISLVQLHTCVWPCVIVPGQSR